MPRTQRANLAGVILWLVAFSTSSTMGRLDLFISKDEMQRLMGIQGELWYVEDGIIDRAAVDYEMEIRPHVDELYFSWSSRGASSIPFTITINSDRPAMTQPKLKLSIPSTGTLEPSGPFSDDADNPATNANVFSIRLPLCETQNPIDFRFRIRFKFDWPSSSNRTEFEIRRKKRCSDGMGSSEGGGDLEDSMKRQPEISTMAQFLGSATNVFYVGMGALFGLVIIMASLIILYFSKTDQGASCCCSSGKVVKEIENADDVASCLLPSAPKSQVVSSTPLNRQSAVLAFERGYSGGSVSSSSGAANRRPLPRSASPSARSKSISVAAATSFVSAANGPNAVHIQLPQQQPQQLPPTDTLPRVLRFNDNRELDLGTVVEQLLAGATDIEFGQVLLEGTFGEVRIGRMKMKVSARQTEAKDSEEDRWSDVFVKSLKEKTSVQQVTRFLRESLRFVDLPQQPNLASPTAIFKSGDDHDETRDQMEHESPVRYAVCYAHNGFGNLKKFLLRCRGADSAASALGPPPMVLSTQDLVYIALQIIRGLLHLHNFRMLHRDVATRNCLIGHDLTVQICDTGLSRDLFPQDYHCLGDNENRPIKWLALESLERSEFSTASDVWAFGVTLWELTTLAHQPYVEVDPFEMQDYLSSDNRLIQPYNCPDELYLLMYCCWNLHAEARPTLNQLLSALEHFYAQLTQYI